MVKIKGRSTFLWKINHIFALLVMLCQTQVNSFISNLFHELNNHKPFNIIQPKWTLTHIEYLSEDLDFLENDDLDEFVEDTLFEFYVRNNDYNPILPLLERMINLLINIGSKKFIDRIQHIQLISLPKKDGVPNYDLLNCYAILGHGHDIESYNRAGINSLDFNLSQLKDMENDFISSMKSVYDFNFVYNDNKKINHLIKDVVNLILTNSIEDDECEQLWVVYEALDLVFSTYKTNPLINTTPLINEAKFKKAFLTILAKIAIQILQEMPKEISDFQIKVLIIDYVFNSKK